MPVTGSAAEISGGNHERQHDRVRKLTPTIGAETFGVDLAGPLGRTRPEIGRKALFVNRGFTTRIAQLAKSESDALLEMLFRHVELTAFSCRFKWRANSVAFWDNRAAQRFRSAQMSM